MLIAKNHEYSDKVFLCMVCTVKQFYAREETTYLAEYYEVDTR